MPDKPTIAHGDDFLFGAVDGIAAPAHLLAAPHDVSLGALAPLLGSWKGHGFNTIFRPLNRNFPTNLPVPPTDPVLDNILELNVTEEKLTFSRIDGDIPNRGMVQADIALAGMTYLQQISDTVTGTGIHLEPGIWIVIPQATAPGADVRVARMASIPHGTTINAQGQTHTFVGGPNFTPVNITPTLLNGGQPVRFRSQTVTNNDAARLPQDLTQLSASGTITQRMIDDPNSVLQAAIAGQNIVKTTVITVEAGTKNIDFLVNGGEEQDQPDNPNGPNANAVKMTATFWIETVETRLIVPPFKLGGPPVQVALTPIVGHAAPTLTLDPRREVKHPTPITLRFLQLQYTQTVFLNFNGLSWPHVSVATLRPDAVLPVPHTAW